MIRNILFEDIDMDSPGIALEMDLDWFPAYGNCVLPEEFRGKPHPAHWDTLLAPVVPPERGIPVLEEITFRNVRARNAKVCCELRGSELIRPRKINFDHVALQGEKAGVITCVEPGMVRDFTVDAPDTPPDFTAFRS